MQSKGGKNAECVKVVVRCRPLSQKEISDGHNTVVEMENARGTINLHNPKAPNEQPRSFTFDSIYDTKSQQSDLYDETFRPLVDSVLGGFNGTIFAYGQTGTGKTYTMEGVRNNPSERGVIPNSFEHIFQHIARSENQQYLVRASYLEIYQEEIRDLLHKEQDKRLELKERPDIGVFVKDLSSFVTKSVQEIEHVMTVGNENRKVGPTNMNAHSSRSHAIFIITVECSEPGLDGKNHIRVGRLNLVDLAGSERQSKTGSQGERFKEATKINLSLSALGNVISALVDGKSSHIPYRDSKLTRLLQDSLGGNAKTVMVANIGPASYNYEETLGTLRYANRAKNIKNKPKINEDPKDALLREFQEEIAKLKSQLANRGVDGGKKKRKSKTKVGASGESITETGEGEEEEGEGEVEAEVTEEYVKEQRARLEQERDAIMRNSNIIAEEKSKILMGIEERAGELERQQEAMKAMAQKIRAMESKLLSGGHNILDHTNQQERALEHKRQELAEQRRKEREMLQQLENQEESALEIKQTFNNMQQEVEVKTKKLKKMFAKLQQIKGEMRDLHSEHSQERQDLENTITELTKELKLKVLIIENFVPLEVRERVLGRAVYDEDEDGWKMLPHTAPSTSTASSLKSPPLLSGRPVSVPQERRPRTDFARLMAIENGPQAFRFRGENILLCQLLLPDRTTKDYHGPDIAPTLQDALDEVMLEEEKDRTMLIDASRVSSAEKNSRLRGKNNGISPSDMGLGSRDQGFGRQNRTKNSHTTHTALQTGGKTTNNSLYPKPRGLVAKT